MKSKLINQQPKIYALILDVGDEVIASVTGFAKENNLNACQLTAIGAFSNATFGYFNIDTKEYEKIPVNEQVEVLSLIGDITLSDGEPKLHAHVVAGKRNGSTIGGHLLKATVRPTLEVILTEAPAHLQRTMNKEFGIPLIAL